MTDPISGERDDCLVECDERSGWLRIGRCRGQTHLTPEYPGNLRGHAAVRGLRSLGIGAAALHLIAQLERHAPPHLLSLNPLLGQLR